MVVTPLAIPHARPVAEARVTNPWPARCLLAATGVATFAGLPAGVQLGGWAATGRMADVPWAAWVQAHGQAQLFGWLGLTILGVTFHAMAHLFRAGEMPPRVTAWVLALQLAGVATRLGVPFAARVAPTLDAWCLLASALALAAAFAVTLEAHGRSIARRPPGVRGPAVIPRFLLVGLALWLAALLANLDGAFAAIRSGTPVAGAMSAAHDAFVNAAAAHGMAMFALGMSLRVAAGWVDLPRPDLARAARAWMPLAVGAVARSLAPVMPAGALATLAEVVGALAWGAGIALYLPVLRGLWAASTARAGGGAGGDADPPLAWFVRAAYAWLAVAGVLAVVEAALRLVGPVAGGSAVANLADAARHALVFGYLGLLTAGLSGRLPTAFLDVPEAVASTRGRYAATLVLLAIASLARVAAPFVAPLPGLHGWLIVASGTAAVAGMACLLATQWHVLRRGGALPRLA